MTCSTWKPRDIGKQPAEIKKPVPQLSPTFYSESAALLILSLLSLAKHSSSLGYNPFLFSFTGCLLVRPSRLHRLFQYSLTGSFRLRFVDLLPLVRLHHLDHSP